MLTLAWSAEQAVSIRTGVEGRHLYKIDVLEAYRRNAFDHVRAISFRLFLLPLLVHAVHVMHVSSHRGVGQ